MTTIYVSPEGKNRNDGLSPTENSGSGPLRSIQAAIKRTEKMREQGQLNGPVTIELAGARYELVRPLEISGDLTPELCLTSAPGETAILDGSIAITQWQKQGKHWIADLSSILPENTPVRTLFCNAETRPRARYPKEGWLYVEDVSMLGEDYALFDGSTHFQVAEGDFDPEWTHPEAIDIIVNHLWVEERMPVSHYESSTQTLHSTHRSIFALKNKAWNGPKHARYFLENVYEALSEPGEWYFDHETLKLHYIPKENETPDNVEIRIPRLTQLIRIHGSPEQTVNAITLNNLQLEHTDWLHTSGWGKWWDPAKPETQWEDRDSFKHFIEDDLVDIAVPDDTRFAAMPQACFELPGVISLEYAHNCTIKNCSFQNLGFYAIDLRQGCQRNTLSGNTLKQIGGGGIKLDGGDAYSPLCKRTSENIIADNEMTGLGKLFANGVGIMIAHSGHNIIEHNLIADLYYTGISVGWEWGYNRSVSEGNQILYNHIHTIGQKRLSDMGAIYTLGVQAGTTIKGNLIHDVQGDHYGGWGIYLDEGSSYIRVEDNLVYNVGSQGLHEHWGRCNLYFNNIFALCEGGGITLSREESNGWVRTPPQDCTFTHNIVLTKGTFSYKDNQAYLDLGILRSDLNLYWDTEDQENMTIWNYAPWEHFGFKHRKLSLSDLKKCSTDLHSLCQDPKFSNPEKGDFTLAEDSPAYSIGIRKHTFTDAGVRPPEARGIKKISMTVLSDADQFGD